MPARIEQRILGYGARRDNAHDFPPHHSFGTSLFRLGRVFGLFANCDTESFSDKAGQIGFGSMYRYAAHRDIGSLVLAAFCQRDIECRRGLFGVVEEHRVEIAHAIKQQRVRMRMLDFEILRHHRR